ncbi:phosphatidylglycerophosphatase A family protein [Teredinibacter purpureus]|uniref:phosphatidylglycerophosphatase A family protein n=1 Tax=Teredinibacter purpureus TaxID=2731756 RepID=UPI0005F8708E|nr:phosphatidylglycerophosphatase A [Teredinibacter purpureus]
MAETNPTVKQLLRDPRLLFAFGFGSGLSPIVPGTMGTLMAVPLYWLLASLALPYYIGVVIVASVVGIYLCGYASKVLGVHDHKGIVWDEFVGLWITLIAVPFSWQTLMAGFVLFRFFDMVKPWPISVVDRKVHGGFGIMVDDVLAGIAAAVILQVLMAYGML